jgi:hypothetical protein
LRPTLVLITQYRAYLWHSGRNNRFSRLTSWLLVPGATTLLQPTRKIISGQNSSASPNLSIPVSISPTIPSFRKATRPFRTPHVHHRTSTETALLPSKQQLCSALAKPFALAPASSKAYSSISRILSLIFFHKRGAADTKESDWRALPLSQLDFTELE